MELSVEIIEILSVVLAVIAFAQFVQRNDEFLFIPLFFFAATGLLRFQAVTTGLTHWVEVAYALDIFNLNDELAIIALNYFFFGTGTFILGYYFFSRNTEEKTIIYDSPELYSKFVQQNKQKVIYFFLIVLGVNAITQGVIRSASQLAYGLSYFYLFQLAIGGMILLMYLVFDEAKGFGSSNDKFIYGGGILIAAYLSYNPYLRFQFLSWMIALVLLWSRNQSPAAKTKYYLIGGAAAIMAFAMAGNARHEKFTPLDTEDKLELAIRRIMIAEDLNMLDGLMMVLQVYPEHLEYHYGTEHLEILMRPIPRALWPGKPVGGYANKLGLNSNMENTTVGISQTMFGSFYGEGGIVGILIFSGLYAFVFVRIFHYAFRFHSPFRFLIKGIAVASLIPLLRGGDLPGIYAFIGMSYWPVFLSIYWYKKFLQREKHIALAQAEALRKEQELIANNTE